MPLARLPDSDVAFLREAAAYLEAPSYLMKLVDAIGKPLQKIAKRVVPAKVAEVGNEALRKAMSLAVGTIFTTSGTDDLEQAYRSSEWTGFWHRILVTLTGATGGAFGLAGLAVELPVTTGILFRSIASIADDFGEDLRKPEVRLECLTVFSHGGPGPDDDAMDASYITARIAMAKLVRDAAKFIAGQSAEAICDAIAKGSAPVLINFLNRIAAQFNVVVSQKFLAQTIPGIGIATGAAINNAFAGHFNSVARYHFGIRHLERRYGEELVHGEYRRQLAEVRGSKRLGE